MLWPVLQFQLFQGLKITSAGTNCVQEGGETNPKSVECLKKHGVAGSTQSNQVGG